MSTPLDAPLTGPKRPHWAQIIFLSLELLLWAIALLSLPMRQLNKPGFDDLFTGLGDIALGSLNCLYVLFPVFLLGSRGWIRHIASYGVGITMVSAVNSIIPLFGVENKWNSELSIWGYLIGLVLVFLVVLMLKRNPARWHDGYFYKQVSIRLGFFLLCSIYSVLHALFS